MADKTKRSWFGRTVLAAVMPVAAQAQTVQDGMAAFEQGDYTHALELLLPLAEQGDAEAQCQVGRLYYHGGDGVPQSFDDSVPAGEGDDGAGSEGREGGISTSLI